ncbi:MAG: ribokinase [Anaerolineae bacterium]|jgi:ribokinase|nr:ribokinase [Anaerolineae bacterium]
MATWDVVVLGSAHTDYMMWGEALPKANEEHYADLFLTDSGGKGVNQAVAAARLGARVALIGCVGQDKRGDAILHRLEIEGVDLKYVYQIEDAPTGVVMSHFNHNGEKQTTILKGANAALTVEDVSEALVLGSAKVLLLQLGISVLAGFKAAEIARRNGAFIILDPAPVQPIPDELMQIVGLIKPNADEARQLTGIPVTDRDSARAAAHRLRETGPAAVIVQVIDSGNLLLTDQGEIWLPEIPVNRLDTTGAGDAFAAACAVGIAEGMSWEAIGQFASESAALTTTRYGALPAFPKREHLMTAFE